MSLFSSSEPYTPIMRKSRNNKPLTPEQARYILENPNQTGYTYAKSASYSPNNPREYINPNLSRSSLLSSDTSSSSFCDTSRSSSKAKEKKKDISKILGWIWIFVMISLLLIGWRTYLMSTCFYSNMSKCFC